MKYISKTKGFTLIELLVVIAIIGILASVILASLNTARSKAKKAATLQSITQVKLALEYYYDTYNTYPSAGSASTYLNNIGGALQPWLSSMPNEVSSSQYIASTTGYAIWLTGMEDRGDRCVTGVSIDPSWFLGNSRCSF